MADHSSIFNSDWKRFTAKILILFLLLFILDRGLGFVIGNLFKSIDWGTSGAETNAIIGSQADVIIFGSSSTEHGIDPDIIADSLRCTVVNAGQDGQVVTFEYAILTMLLKHHTPKMIIWDVNNKDYNCSEADLRAKRLLPFSADKVARQIAYDIDPFNRLLLLSHCARYNSIVFNLATSALLKDKMSGSGFHPIHDKKSLDQTMVSMGLDKYHWDPEWNINLAKNHSTAIVRHYFQAFIDICKANNIQLIAISSPYAPIDAHKYLDSPLLPNVRSALAENSIPLVVFPPAQYPEFINLQHFCDLSHLNADGAELFTKELAHQVKSYIR